MTVTHHQTIREVVAADYRAAAVFQRYGLDFCCRGNRTIEQACVDAGLSAEAVSRDVQTATASPAPGLPRFDSWDLQTLTSYIVANHHTFVRAQLPLIQGHARKVARVHGERHPEMVRVAAIFDGVAEEMTSHMMKEEQILFPFIEAMAGAAAAEEDMPLPPFGSVGNPIRMMEMEHESAGGAMAEIRVLTDGYRIPEGACGTFTVLLRELEGFEQDLHQHVHLENNILFPRALQLEQGAQR